MIRSLVGVKLAVALSAGALSLGGAAAVAHPAPPAPTTQPASSDDRGQSGSDHEGNKPAGAKPVGPDAKGNAAYGLCNAYAHASVHGNAVDHSVAFANLIKAAGGVKKVDKYCAKMDRPGSSADGDGADHGKGRPESLPTPSHKPSSLPSRATHNPGATHRP